MDLTRGKKKLIRNHILSKQNQVTAPKVQEEEIQNPDKLTQGERKSTKEREQRKGSKEASKEASK